ncbi:ATP-binding cassette, sub-family E, member 1 [Cryptococcus neoformans]|uniref:Translation initiation factor RLI1 n=2 Tax=Cryptococcus neoformans TaxID=5207 RepID=A0A854QKM6_CRYNE|nr:ATP-binding cassette, sub-family E, member 1 [Cryptococcus neoformans var. grubii H99]AUB22365.1 ATP-binding cassette, sub-family E, member 1 [Cryptococcus neoformans var. grubii]OWT37949.1 ATP-binding cassette, sub-family E, member 1 [Cryptococcus neoformans var. grubii Bt1]OWZ36669.1 ATP-binding cassette, sub-family E, member 1 [Cryptococcus neoformans var. grubii AD2-60a]OWZ48339.1 ATP-binding cassette, sub-family E, member 1 [Cryptococcus neoformans var. grubii C23]OWZ55347.1 ATP-bindin|eukprot:XP_012046939.1 ATP-binding cassette, sub-family E, member 1 [Cryptococcus neoformans var. grubii H99]
MSDKLTRVAIISDDKCKPKRCRQECKRSCPVVKMGKLCIEVNPNDKKAFISEELCIGCGICVKKCPFDAIQILNLPTNLESHVTHRYAANAFKLHRLPTPRPGQVLGLVGTNGIGKSTALKIMSGKLKPNLGRYDDPPEWQEILKHFRGSELQNFFTKVLEDDIKAVTKPQYVDQIPRSIKVPNMTVGKMFDRQTELPNRDELEKDLELKHLQSREVSQLSGGELQRFAIGIASVRKADVYMFDEPSSYLDIRQRLAAARVIRGLVNATNYVIVVEHDLATLDYLSDFICVLYGVPGTYGVVTMPYSVREGINIFLDGMIPTENLRFRDESLTFKISETVDELQAPKTRRYQYPSMTKTLGNFKLHVDEGEYSDSEILVMLGENGMGKTTLVQLLGGKMEPDESKDKISLRVSMKPQTISPKFPGSVRMLLLKRIKGAFMHPQFNSDVIKPMNLEPIMDQDVQTLSGGELQRVAICLVLGVPADVLLIDEPSAYLDSEQRILASKVIKKFVMSSKRTAFIVEHDFIMATYLADRVIVFDGQPGKESWARKPEGLLTGMNKFLKSLDITFRRDPTNFRPRINKMDSLKDKEQKAEGAYFFVDSD